MDLEAIFASPANPGSMSCRILAILFDCTVFSFTMLTMTFSVVSLTVFFHAPTFSSSFSTQRIPCISAMLDSSFSPRFLYRFLFEILYLFKMAINLLLSPCPYQSQPPGIQSNLATEGRLPFSIQLCLS